MHRLNQQLTSPMPRYYSPPGTGVFSRPDSLTTGGLHVFMINVHMDSRWDRFVDSHPEGLIYHHSAWLTALETEYSRNCVALACEDSNGILFGVLPLFYTSGLPFNLGSHQTVRRLSSLPRTPVAGPLGTNREAVSALVQGAMNLASEKTNTLLEIKMHAGNLGELEHGPVRIPWRLTYILNVQDGPLRGNSRSRARVKWAVKKASRMGVQVRVADTEGDLRSWYQIYLRTMRRNVVPPRPYRFFASLWNLLQPHGYMKLLLTELPQDGKRRLLAGSIFLSFKDTLLYAFNGSREEDFSLHSNDIIIWHAIRDARNKGLKWFDFGEVAEGRRRLVQFKMKWGSEPKQLYRYYYPEPKGSKEPRMKLGNIAPLFKASWRRIPLRATAKLGDWLYSYL